jgi:hypothetical protein
VALDVERDPGMGLQETRQMRDQPARAEGRQGGEAQQRGFRAGHGAQHGCLALLQQLARIGQEPAAGFRKHHALAHPLEQRHAELGLQIPDLTADGALGQVELAPRLSDAAMACGTLESLKPAKVGNQGARQGHAGSASCQMDST